MEYRKHPERFWSHILVAIITYSFLLIPFIFADICLEVYHQICFRLLKIPLVDRRKYIQIWDRTELRYLNLGDKIACAFCGYANGFAHYLVVIGAETEKYWCSIQHKRPFKYQLQFLRYGDEEKYRSYGRSFVDRLLDRDKK